MAKPEIFHQIDKGIIVVTINRPEYGNKLNINILENLIDICDLISSNQSIKVMIITGSGNKAFSQGADSEFIIPQNKPSIAELISNIGCPVIAAINGDVFAEGLELSLACDIRVATPKSKFSLPAIKYGQIPSNGGTQFLPRIVGASKALELILSGDIIESEEALNIGLISEIIEQKELLSTVKKMAFIMAEKSPLALNFAKEAIIKGLDLTLEQGLRLEADLYFLLHTTEDRSEGIKAFREKRRAIFKGI